MSKIEQANKQALEALLRECRDVSLKVAVNKILERTEELDPYFFQGPDDSLDLEAITKHLHKTTDEDSI
jgi:hypothetical protein